MCKGCVRTENSTVYPQSNSYICDMCSCRRRAAAECCCSCLGVWRCRCGRAQMGMCGESRMQSGRICIWSWDAYALILDPLASWKLWKLEGEANRADIPEGRGDTRCTPSLSALDRASTAHGVSYTQPRRLASLGGGGGDGAAGQTGGAEGRRVGPSRAETSGGRGVMMATA